MHDAKENHERKMAAVNPGGKEHVKGLPPKPKSLPFHGRVIFRCRISHLDVLLLLPVVNKLQ